MTEYLSPLSTILISLGDGNWSSSASISSAASSSSPSLKSFDVGADGRQLLAHYAVDVFDALLTNLDSKARILMKGKSVLGVFLSNNVAIIDRGIRNSDLQSLLQQANNMSRIDGWRKKATSMYLDAWKEPSTYLFDVQYTNRGSQRPPSGSGQTINSAEIIKSLDSKKKDAIKEKFRMFNTTFDELVARHKALHMEREVRELLAKQVQQMIEPLYARFWDRYHEIDKGKGKYVKYDKNTISTVLASLS
jgi:exocyst complex protein 7